MYVNDRKMKLIEELGREKFSLKSILKAVEFISLLS